MGLEVSNKAQEELARSWHGWRASLTDGLDDFLHFIQIEFFFEVSFFCVLAIGSEFCRSRGSFSYLNGQNPTLLRFFLENSDGL